ncbi:YeeE/YedE family protein [Thalassotalea sp. LPB0316]|nr:YeeE/YedE family protein [Thalassotalea sp. LPB0316]
MMVSGMTVPSNVHGFLSIFNDWNPSLMFVIGGALLVFLPIYNLGIKSLERPILAESFCVTSKTQVDEKLIFGSIIFGIGWGILGVCPGPVFSSMFLGNSDVFWFIFAMIIGFSLVSLLESKSPAYEVCEVQ